MTTSGQQESGVREVSVALAAVERETKELRAVNQILAQKVVELQDLVDELKQTIKEGLESSDSVFSVPATKPCECGRDGAFPNVTSIIEPWTYAPPVQSPPFPSANAELPQVQDTEEDNDQDAMTLESGRESTKEMSPVPGPATATVPTVEDSDQECSISAPEFRSSTEPAQSFRPALAEYSLQLSPIDRTVNNGNVASGVFGLPRAKRKRDGDSGGGRLMNGENGLSRGSDGRKQDETSAAEAGDGKTPSRRAPSLRLQQKCYISSNPQAPASASSSPPPPIPSTKSVNKTKSSSRVYCQKTPLPNYPPNLPGIDRTKWGRAFNEDLRAKRIIEDFDDKRWTCWCHAVKKDKIPTPRILEFLVLSHHGCRGQVVRLR